MDKTVIERRHCIGAVDDRYADKTVKLTTIFSEWGLMKRRLFVEVEYFICLSIIAGIIRHLMPDEIELLRNLYQNFSDADFDRIIEIEKGKDGKKGTNHDVKAVEYFMKEKIKNTSLGDIYQFTHFGRTSGDINNISCALQLTDGTEVLLENYSKIKSSLYHMATENENVSMLALTHGQPAVSTTLGWEIAVFYKRLETELSNLYNAQIFVKFNGATGGDNACWLSYPNVNWTEFSENFIAHINHIYNPKHKLVWRRYTTQIEARDSYASLFDNIKRINNILLDFSKDMWGYISRNVFVEKMKEGEVGSSAMPGKVNPIDYENAEGNLGLSNVLFEFFGSKLTISRYQRDLSCSTTERNFGTAFGWNLVALNSIQKGLSKAQVNLPAINTELENNWIIIGEAYQTILKRENVTDAYEILLKLTRGKKDITKEFMHDFIDSFGLSHGLKPSVVEELKAITPFNYIGNRKLVFD